MLVHRWLSDLAGSRVRIMLADGDDSRVREGAQRLALTTPITPVLLSDTADPGGGIKVLRPTTRTDPIERVLDETLASRPDSERERLSADPLFLGAAAVRAGIADACVGGSDRPTAARNRCWRCCPSPRRVAPTIRMSIVCGRRPTSCAQKLQGLWRTGSCRCRVRQGGGCSRRAPRLRAVPTSSFSPALMPATSATRALNASLEPLPSGRSFRGWPHR